MQSCCMICICASLLEFGGSKGSKVYVERLTALGQSQEPSTAPTVAHPPIGHPTDFAEALQAESHLVAFLFHGKPVNLR